MRTIALGGLAGGLLVAGLAVSSAMRSGPEPAIPALQKPGPVVEAQAIPAQPPAVLPIVVEVADISPLLDPPTIPRTDSPMAPGSELIRVGYVAPRATRPSDSEVKAIPRAAE